MGGKKQKKKNITTRKTLNTVRDDQKKFQKGEVVEAVLGVLVASTIVGGSIVFPTMPIIAASIIGLIKQFRGEEIPSFKLKNALKSLEKRKIIELVQTDSNVYVKFLKEGKAEILKYSIKRILDFKKKKKNWKRKWILVVFDVPEQERKKRTYLRDLLKKLGFYQYQQSVYIFPYECLEEIKLIKEITESGKYLKYIIADKIEEDTPIKAFFGI